MCCLQVYVDTHHIFFTVMREMEVLFETEQEDGSWNGHAGNYCVVNAQGADLKNRMCSVRITAVDGDKLLGEVI